MTTEELKKLRKALPKGSKKILAAKFGLSEGHITQILLGNRVNEMVLISATEIIREYFEKRDQALNVIQSL